MKSCFHLQRQIQLWRHDFLYYSSSEHTRARRILARAIGILGQCRIAMNMALEQY